MAEVHIAKVGLLPIDPLGNVVNKNGASIATMIRTTSEHRVLVNPDVANTAGNPTPDDYLIAEAADDFILIYQDQYQIITSDVIAGGGGVSIPVLATPPIAPSSGDLFISSAVGYNYMMMVYNSTLGKWLSIDRELFEFGREGNSVDNQYLNTGGDVEAGNNGYTLHRPATILSASIRIGGGNDTKSFEIRKNGVLASIATLTLGGGGATFVKNVSLNVDVAEDDYLQFFVTSAGAAVIDPVGLIEIAWRQS